jgi:CspA family cold shock protein
VQKGTVKWFNPTKGYGFIRPSTGEKDVFVHISAVERAGLRTLNEGQVVEYDLVTQRGKTSADSCDLRQRPPEHRPGVSSFALLQGLTSGGAFEPYPVVVEGGTPERRNRIGAGERVDATSVGEAGVREDRLGDQDAAPHALK